MSEFMDIGDVARLLGVDFDAVHRLIDSGQLPAVVHHHGTVIPKESVFHYLAVERGK